MLEQTAKARVAANRVRDQAGRTGLSRVAMKTVNRTAIVVAPKEPYYAWARGLEADSPIDEQTVDDLSQGRKTGVSSFFASRRLYRGKMN